MRGGASSPSTRALRAIASDGGGILETASLIVPPDLVAAGSKNGSTAIPSCNSSTARRRLFRMITHHNTIETSATPPIAPTTAPAMTPVSVPCEDDDDDDGARFDGGVEDARDCDVDKDGGGDVIAVESVLSTQGRG